MVVDNVPVGNNTTKGTPVSTLIQLEPTEKIIAVTSLHRSSTPKYAIFVTKNGMLKKTHLEEYMKVKRNAGIAALTLKEGDSLVDIIFQDDEDMILVTENGMGIKFPTKDIAPIGRVAMGVKAIKLNEGDSVIKSLPVHKQSDNLAIILRTGKGKKIELNELPVQARGGKGVFVVKGEEDVTVAGAAMVDDTDNLLLSGNTNSICISASELPLLTRNSIGNILIKNNRVMIVTKL